MAQAKALDLEAMLRSCDHENASDHVGVFFTVSPELRALLLTTARAARCSQSGILRIGLQLVAVEVERSMSRQPRGERRP